MPVLDTMEQCVRDKKLLSALQNIAQHEHPLETDQPCN